MAFVELRLTSFIMPSGPQAPMTILSSLFDAATILLMIAGISGRPVATSRDVVESQPVAFNLGDPISFSTSVSETSWLAVVGVMAVTGKPVAFSSSPREVGV